MVKFEKVFLNLTAHQLLPEQVEAAEKEFGVKEFVEAGDVFPAEVVQALRQSPSNPGELVLLAYAVADGLVEYARKEGVRLYVHLPTGSPAFMWALAGVFPHAYAIPVFSHSRRVVEDVRQEDGSVKKVSKFKFEHYIVL